jgi:hypothetical protein
MSSIPSHVETFIDLVIEQFSGIEKTELLHLWNQALNALNSNLNSNPLLASEKELRGMKIPVLKQLCKDRKLKCTGVKETLVQRLLGGAEPAEKPKTKNAQKSQKAKPQASILSRIQNDHSVFISRNKFGQFVHPETQFVFHPVSRSVIAKAKHNGKTSDLTEEDISTCYSKGFNYRVTKEPPFCYVDIETNLVFSEESLQVVGKYVDSMIDSNLSEGDIEYCKVNEWVIAKE